jgi:glycerol uptake facilitator-like aquaporin
MATLARWRAAGAKGRMAARGRRASKRGLSGIARVVSLIASIVVGLLLVAIVLVLLEANRDNAIVDALLDAGAWLAEPFDNIFSMDSRKERIAVNYGLAAVVYAIAGGLIVRLLRR